VRLIAGLGNPGARYQHTRHNVGFWVVDRLAQRWDAACDRYQRRFEGLTGEAQRGADRVLLLKPQTFMNVSGRSVAAAARFYRIEPDDILIVHDDLDLEPGRIRVRARGSSGGHKGLTDVLQHLGTEQVPRLRIGIGSVPAAATTEYVLSRFGPQQQERVDLAVDLAADAVECWLEYGIDEAMNRYNARQV
jgi:PTH1 family peptidyl-tRNA hydrolase